MGASLKDPAAAARELGVGPGTNWPDDGLESVPACPLCDDRGRDLIHKALWDNSFFSAPGTWSLWRCRGCRSAYLDPRPNPATIGLAYRRYYTHERADPSSPSSALARLRQKLGNGYRNWRYGTQLAPASRLGILLSVLLPPLRWPADMGYRWLPRHGSAARRRVLDIGCGGGDWLQAAREAGWSVAGVEPDPQARAHAVAAGIDVRPGLSDWSDHEGRFDAVTLSHVIEHVHDPLETLGYAYALLRPGGQIFVDTPNIDAHGHELYGRDWRGLETPRHLVIFNRESLTAALEQAGFTDIRFPRRLYPFRGISHMSRRMAAGLDPYASDGADRVAPPPGLLVWLKVMIARKHSEFLTAIARKPA